MGDDNFPPRRNLDTRYLDFRLQFLTALQRANEDGSSLLRESARAVSSVERLGNVMQNREFSLVCKIACRFVFGREREITVVQDEISAADDDIREITPFNCRFGAIRRRQVSRSRERRRMA